MKVGVSTSCLYPMLTEEALIKIGESGIKNTEVFFNALGELEPNFINELKSIKENYGLNILSVHPAMSLAESFMLFSAYDRRKEEGLDWFRRYGEICDELGARYVILHGGKPNGVLSDEEYFERFAKIDKAVRENGGTLLQENVRRFRAADLDFLKKMAMYLKDNVGFCLDVKQSIRNGYSPFTAYETLKDNVKHIHISDSTKEKDCMLPLKGDFPILDFIKTVKEGGYNGDLMVEVYEDAYESFDELFSSVKNLMSALK